MTKHLTKEIIMGIVTITIQIEADEELTQAVAEQLMSDMEEIVAKRSFSLYDATLDVEED
jgi:hypothetical protein